MNRQITTISLHPVRAAQLRALAAHSGMTTAELIERSIMTAAKAAGLLDLPGLEILPLGPDALHLSAFDLPVIHLTRGDARTLATVLENIALDNGYHSMTLAPVSLDGEPLPGDTVTVRRVGKGLSLELADAVTGKTHKITMTPVMAIDVAERLVAAAAPE